MVDSIVQNIGQVGDQLVVLLGLTILDFIFGTIAAFKARTFQLEKLGGIVESGFLPILGWFGVVVIAAIPQQLVPSEFLVATPDFVYGLVFIRVAGSILGSIASFGVGTDQLRKIGVQSKI